MFKWVGRIGFLLLLAALIVVQVKFPASPTPAAGTQAEATDQDTAVDLIANGRPNWSGATTKVNSENSAHHGADLANGGTFWRIGSDNQIPAAGGYLWIAFDLGKEQTLTGATAVMASTDEDVAASIHGYALYYSIDGASWSTLPGKNDLTRNPGAGTGWTQAAAYSFAGKETLQTVTYGSGDTFSGVGSSVSFAPVKARYVLVSLKLTGAHQGGIGLADLKLTGLRAKDAPTLSPRSAKFDDNAAEDVKVALNAHGKPFSGIWDKNSKLDPSGYSYDVSKQTVTLSEKYLLTLPSGRATLTFKFGDSDSALLNLSVVGHYSGYYQNKPGYGFAMITPNYTGMSRTIGMPALIDAAKSKFPVFQLSAVKADTKVSMTVTGPDGKVVYSSPETSVSGQGTIAVPDKPLTEGTYKAAFTLANDGKTLYDAYYFSAIKDFTEYKAKENTVNSNNANVANVNPDSTATPYPAVYLKDGKLTYTPDFKGDRIMDYSGVGFKGGGVELPNVPVRITVKPLADPQQDAYAVLQDAIDRMSRLPMQDDGFRGTLYLSEGVYRVSKPLYVRASGIVIRGAGSGKVVQHDTPYNGSNYSYIANENFESGVTKLITTWTMKEFSKDEDSTLINFVGSPSESSSNTVTVADQYAGAGTNVVHVSSTAGYHAGDTVMIRKKVNADWARALYMDKVDGGNDWTTAKFNFQEDRTIAAVDADAHTLILAEPLSDALDLRWGVATVEKYSVTGQLRNVGLEYIQGISHFYDTKQVAVNVSGVDYSYYPDEKHPMVFVRMKGVQDGWVRNFTTYHFDTGARADSGSRNLTFQDGNLLDPVSIMNTGSRRYGIDYDSTARFIFTQRIFTRYMRHAFVVGSNTSGPNVFYNCTNEFNAASSEPHFRWSSGGLYDNVFARIQVQNRWSAGTSHGWAGVNYVLYNTEGAVTVTQPQLAPNYLIGHSYTPTDKIGEVSDKKTGWLDENGTSSNMKDAGLNGGMKPQYPAYMYSLTAKVSPKHTPFPMPDSLYIEQLTESKGADAARVVETQKTAPDNVENVEGQ